MFPPASGFPRPSMVAVVLCSALIAVLVVPAFLDGPPSKAPVPAPSASTVPSRIVSLAPNLTEIAFAVGAGKQVVGVTEYCDFPPEVRALPRVGGFATPSLEAILGLRPDLVLATEDGNDRGTVERIEEFGIPVCVAHGSSVEAIPGWMEEIGVRSGHAAAGKKAADRFRAEVRAIQERVEGRPRPRVLFVYGGDPLIVAGPGSFADDLLRIAGGENLAAEATSRYPHLSLEVLLARGPDVILQESSMSGGAPSDAEAAVRAEWARWPTIPAVREGRVHLLDADRIDRPGPRLVEGLRTVARLLHPEAFLSAAAASSEGR